MTPDPIQPLRDAARECRACDLWKIGTQTVFGEGAEGARIVFVGEQPGDEEDRRGRPFVGPAGQLLDRALAAAGIDRALAYVTNAVKHFKWTPRGTRRIHKTPAQKEVAACHQWLERELAALHPAVIVCLGRTAAQSVLGRVVTIGAVRGTVVAVIDGASVMVTMHPSAILRMRDAEREVAFAALVDDLRKVAPVLKARTAPPAP